MPTIPKIYAAVMSGSQDNNIKKHNISAEV